MSMTTNSLVARAKKLAVPAGILATILFSAAFLFDYGRAHAAAAAAGPLDESSVSSLVALDNAVEAVASRVTPAVVNVAVTSRVSQDDQDSEDGGHSFNFGGVNPQDLPPGFRQFFFGPGGQQQMKPQPQFEHGVGSGVILSPDGYIVTNDHVVDGATQIRVTLNDRRVFTAKLIGVDKLNDLAVIKIDAHDLPSVPWGDSSKLNPGETVLAFGNPFGNFPVTRSRAALSAVSIARILTGRSAQARRLHPDRRGHQSRQLRRAAGECAWRGHRHQHLHHLGQRIVCRRGLCNSFADRSGNGAEQIIKNGKRAPRLPGHHHERRDARQRRLLQFA
jgi:hypothetical protein